MSLERWVNEGLMTLSSSWWSGSRRGASSTSGRCANAAGWRSR